MNEVNVSGKQTNKQKRDWNFFSFHVENIHGEICFSVSLNYFFNGKIYLLNWITFRISCHRSEETTISHFIKDKIKYEPNVETLNCMKNSIELSKKKKKKAYCYISAIIYLGTTFYCHNVFMLNYCLDKNALFIVLLFSIYRSKVSN